MTDNLNNSNDTSEDASVELTNINAEHLLTGVPFFREVLKLRDTLSRSSDGAIVDYDKLGDRLKDEVDALPTLEIQLYVPSGTESVYQNQLLHALERINDEHDRLAHKLFKMQSRLMNAISLMDNQRAQFVAFFSLALPVAIHELRIPKFNLSKTAIENIAKGEYSRIMEGLDNAAPSTICELKILQHKIKLSKAAQAAKYQLGKEQVNLMWNSIQKNGSLDLDGNPNRLLKSNNNTLDEEDDEIPSFVSKYTKEVRVGASISQPKLIEPETDTEEVELKGTFFKTGDPQPIKAIVADEVTLETPSEESLTSTDSPPKEDYTLEDLVKLKDAMESAKHPEPEEGKTFGKALEANGFKPVTGELLILPEGPVVQADDFESIMNTPEPLATPAFSTQRTRLMILDEDEV